jgi:CRISPR-associated protein Cmr1
MGGGLMLEAVFRVVTPLFLGGADGTEAEIRAASLKGALRFWYRATSYSAGADITTIKKKEEEIFGSSEKGQSSFLIDVVDENIKIIDKGHKWKGQGMFYLGYGLINFKGIQTKRKCINSGGSFRVRFCFRGKKMNLEENRAVLVKALTALDLFGGLGSRSRRGFGSLTLESLLVDEEEKAQLLADVSELQDKIKEFCRSLGELTQTLPPYTAFSSQSRIVLGAVKDSPLVALDEIGKELIRYRSYGREEGRTGRHILPWGEDARQKFKGDHDLVRDFAATGTADKHPERVVFGLPHNYIFRAGKDDELKVDIEGASEEYQRRASPLFIHIHKLKNGYVPVLTFLPAEFLPERGRIVLKKDGTGGGHRIEVPCTVGGAGYKVITNFLDRLPGRQEVRLS